VILVAERPGVLSLAWDDLRTRGSRWEKAAKRGLVLANHLRPEVHNGEEQHGTFFRHVAFVFPVVDGLGFVRRER